MIVALYIYVDGIAKRIELFNDEKISVNSSIQNVNDISKVFTDYSNSFTIPASDTNNAIFKYWFDNSNDNGFDQRLRYDGYIEIDTQIFRVGKWQLESASIKENRIEDYKITFYGNLVSLTDKFKEDKLKDVAELNDYSINYSGANVQSAITSTTDNDIMFPLISSDRFWEYGSGNQNIGNSSHKIYYYELFPAIKLKRVFDAIATKYNVNFDGTFLSQDRFTKAYLWLKKSEAKRLDAYSSPFVVAFNNFTPASGRYKFIDNTLEIYSQPTDPNLQQFLRIRFRNFSVTTTAIVKVFKVINGVDNEISNTTYNVAFGTPINQMFITPTMGVGTYRFTVQTASSCTFVYDYMITNTSFNDFVNGSHVVQNKNGSTTSLLDSALLSPDIKVADFFSGILKMFNLTAYTTDGINYTLEQLENWYYQGQIRDYSQYTTTDLEFNRVKPYKKINFEYERSESILNKQYFALFNNEYGNLSYPFNNDGSEFTIKLPFENLMFRKFTGTNIQVGFALKPDLTPYQPKPIILYLYERASCSFYLNNGITTNHITNYNVFGQDVKYQTENHSLNWGAEISSYLLNIVNNSLFNNYYLAYLNNLYSLKSRMVKVKMRLPYTEILDLKLNDRIIIRDKRYIINQYTTDLTTFESDFELIQDFRSLYFNNSGAFNTDRLAKTLTFNTTSKEPLTWTEQTSSGLIQSITNQNTYVNVEVKENVSGVKRTATLISKLGDIIIIEQNA